MYRVESVDVTASNVIDAATCPVEEDTRMRRTGFRTCIEPCGMYDTTFHRIARRSSSDSARISMSRPSTR